MSGSEFNFKGYIDLLNKNPRYRLVRESSSSDGLLHVVTYYRSDSRNIEVGAFCSRVFRDGFVPEAVTTSAWTRDESEALDLHDSLVEAFLAVYESAPCLLEGAL